MVENKSEQAIGRNEKTKEFVVYQRLFHDTTPSLKRVAGKLVMPRTIENVMSYFQKLNPYGIRMLDALAYVQNEKGIFMPAKGSIAEVSDSYRIKLDSIVFAHSFSTEDTRDPKTRKESSPIAIETEFTDGVITGEIYVPALKKGTGSDEDIPALERYLQRNSVITIHNFKNDKLEDLFEHEEHWDSTMYNKPHRLVVNTDRITAYGFQKRK